ncbi:MAG TPA: NADH-quinone oxidoreductase subunit NuoF [Candidatus Aminicenantes bacterium]|nr:NADH-quinone oxidoreductase subunit NuoF [Candidatus Aminicenantes bacterium]
MAKLRSASELKKFRKDILAGRDPARPCVTLCLGTGCLACGGEQVHRAFIDEIARQGLVGKVDVRRTGCHGFCERGPLAVVFPREICYLKVTAADVPEIVSETLVHDRIVERLLYQGDDGKKIVHENEIPFYKHQSRVILGANRLIDPNRIEDYIALGGYSALAKALFVMTPEEVLDEVKRSGLRGRGGAGFPTGTKWETTRDAHGETKYVVVNADEGDPGAYMNRSVLEGNPHSVIEGLIIGAYAIGARHGYVYVRQEYPLAVANLTVALEQARDLGLLGDNILGSDYCFDVAVHRGAGAFVSGESSALMAAIEGRVGEPRPKYVRTAISGLWGKPTNLNNVETWANVPAIINRGADWFGDIGTAGSKGTKIFSLVGKVKNTGLVEVPMGTPLRRIIYDIGGGISSGKEFKAVQTGGPSGGCLPAAHLDLPVDFEALERAGSMMGSGGMIVMDEGTCMVDTARYFVQFLSEESCGKCVPCREGLKRMLRILTGICAGRGRPGDIDLLEELGEVMSEASLCALGTTAANPLLSTLRYFRDEYEAHIQEKRCPAGACKELIRYHIVPEKCQACMICARSCPAAAISGAKGQVHVIDQSKCTKCGVCLEVCPSRFAAVAKISGKPVPAPVAAGTRIQGKK